MSVTDDQAAALRAQLAGDHEEHRRLLAGLKARGGLAGYTALITSAFIEAVDRRFGPGRQGGADVTAFIRDVRTRFPGADGEIDPAAAERVIWRPLGQGPSVTSTVLPSGVSSGCCSRCWWPTSSSAMRNSASSLSAPASS